MHRSFLQTREGYRRKQQQFGKLQMQVDQALHYTKKLKSYQNNNITMYASKNQTIQSSREKKRPIFKKLETIFQPHKKQSLSFYSSPKKLDQQEIPKENKQSKYLDYDQIMGNISIVKDQQKKQSQQLKHQQNSQKQNQENQRIDKNLQSQFQQIEKQEQKQPQHQTDNQFHLQTFLRKTKLLQTIRNNLTSSKILFLIKKYFEIIAGGRISNYHQFFFGKRNRLIRNAFLYERVSMIVLAFSLTVSECFNQNINYLKNLLNYLFILSHYMVGLLNQKCPSNVLSDYLQSHRLGQFDFGHTLQLVNNLMLKIAKYDNLFSQNIKRIIKQKNSIDNQFKDMLEYFAYWLSIFGLAQRIPFMAVAPNPYLPPIQGKTILIDRQYTLVLDLTNLLLKVTSWKQDNIKFVVRPFAIQFLQEMSQYYQLICFSSGLAPNYSKLVSLFDKQKLFKGKLFRHHCYQNNKKQYIKNLNRLGRRMDRTIIIDTKQQSFQDNMDNGIMIKAWNGNKRDSVLTQLIPLLGMIVIKVVYINQQFDVRTGLRSYKQQMIENIENGIKYVCFGLKL